MKRTLLALAVPLALLSATNVGAVSANSSPGYTPSQIQAPPQFNGGTIATPPRTAPIVPAPAPVIVPRGRR